MKIQSLHTVLGFIMCLFFTHLAQAQDEPFVDKFRQLDELLPTPNVYRTGAGSPGHEYWQQQADYVMNIRLDDDTQRLYGEATITYYNNSPDVLDYIWLQLDQNVRAKDSDTYKIRTQKVDESLSFNAFENIEPWFDGGYKIDYVKNSAMQDMRYIVNKTMMRIDLEEGLKPNTSITFHTKWWYNINDRMKIGGRSGYEYFPEDDNYLYTIAQFFPRLCMYNDVYGWQNKQFLGRGEFTLIFGDYDVKITVPADHVVGATGTIQNMDDVLTAAQQQRYNAAKTATEPVIIISQKDAIKAEKRKSKETKEWHFKAENVRDFAFATSRKFIWDALGVKQENGTTVMAMSLYPKEGNPLWEKYSTKVVAHTLKWYSHYTFDYPYPVAYSIHSARIGMEYPMICFNYGRPEKDGTYTKRMKYGMIGVIIHEVGHNYFPMIVNSDERQWTWMDEGLNTFLQYLTEQHWERNYPSRRGEPYKIADYMRGSRSYIAPIMTNSESIFQFGNNAYGKPSTALNILRETIMGRELFDYAFKTYANKWKFKHPTPADFFRTMEDASAVDLDWFWRGWFYGTEHVDLAISNVRAFDISSQNPSTESKIAKANRAAQPKTMSEIRNKKSIVKTEDESDKSVIDFYTTYDELDFDPIDMKNYRTKMDELNEDQRQILKSNKRLYEVTIDNVGGLIMPIILQLNYADGTTEKVMYPAEIWRLNPPSVTKLILAEKEISSFQLDPNRETADVDTDNNNYPKKESLNRLELFKQNHATEENAMQRARRAGTTNN